VYENVTLLCVRVTTVAAKPNNAFCVCCWAHVTVAQQYPYVKFMSPATMHIARCCTVCSVSFRRTVRLSRSKWPISRGAADQSVSVLYEIRRNWSVMKQ